MEMLTVSLAFWRVSPPSYPRGRVGELPTQAHSIVRRGIVEVISLTRFNECVGICGLLVISCGYASLCVRKKINLLDMVWPKGKTSFLSAVVNTLL
jgi:hypothetical protein